jgi:hypothetical protein
MPFTYQRAASVLAATLAALALASAPAFAGEDDDDWDDEDWPVQVQQAPAPASSSSASSSAVTAAATPQGGVATGLGGTDAQPGIDLLPFGLAGGSLLLALAGGGIAVARRGVS